MTKFGVRPLMVRIVFGYGQFPNFKGRVITYAASAGDVNKFKTNIPEVLEAIKRFDSISVREVDLQNTFE